LRARRPRSPGSRGDVARSRGAGLGIRGVGSGPRPPGEAATCRRAAAHLASQGLVAETGACAEALARIAADYPHGEVRAALAATLAESAALAGELEQATAYVAEGLALYGEIEAPFERAETLVRAAETSVAVGDRDVAVQHLVDAHGTARKLGARPLATLAASRLAEVGERIDERIGRRAVATCGPGSNASRARGAASRGLGTDEPRDRPPALPSTRTVDMHVRNALAKLDCRTRTQAATRAIELGIVESTASG
jgi:hypothetical protein